MDENRQGGRRGKRWPWVVGIGAVIAVPLLLALLLAEPVLDQVRLVLNGCVDDNPPVRAIDVGPLLAVPVPADMDMVAWAESEPVVTEKREGVWVTVRQMAEVAEARDYFDYTCERWLHPELFVFAGSGDDRSCVSYVDPLRADPEGLCTASGRYRSFVVVQRGNVTVYVGEETTDAESLAREEILVALAQAMARATAAGAYPRIATVAKTGLEVRFGCTACQGTDGSSGPGPAWHGLHGSEVTLADGRVVVADESYLRRALLAPGEELAAGYGAIMPGDYGERLTQAELDALLVVIAAAGD